MLTGQHCCDSSVVVVVVVVSWCHLHANQSSLGKASAADGCPSVWPSFFASSLFMWRENGVMISGGHCGDSSADNGGGYFVYSSSADEVNCCSADAIWYNLYN